jgi:hypothetical protein
MLKICLEQGKRIAATKLTSFYFSFFCLPKKKETKKRAGKTNCSARFAMAHAQVTSLLTQIIHLL